MIPEMPLKYQKKSVIIDGGKPARILGDAMLSGNPELALLDHKIRKTERPTFSEMKATLETRFRTSTPLPKSELIL